MKKKGFTLVELLIVIVIIAILAGIALPSYQAHIRTANRIDIQLEMAELSLIAERQFARQNTYPTFPTKINHSYKLIFSSGIATFEIIAIPQGVQAADECGQMKLNQTGETSDESASKSCW